MRTEELSRNWYKFSSSCTWNLQPGCAARLELFPTFAKDAYTWFQKFIIIKVRARTTHFATIDENDVKLANLSL